MRAKRQILSLLLALLLVWQGFSFANAETGSGTGTSVVTVGSGTGTEASAASSSTISGTSSGSKSGKEIENAIYDPEFLINNDKPLQNGGSLGSYQNLQFKAKIKVQGQNIVEGDYISIQLPKQLKSTDTSFDISGTGGKILAKGIYNETTKEIRITFTKDAENYSGTDGEVSFSTRIDQKKVASTTSAPLKLEINGQTVINYNIKYQVVTKENPKSFYKDRDFHLYKVVDKDGNTHYLIHYTMTLDTRNIQKVPGATSYENIVFTDTLQSDALSYFDVKNPFTDLNLNQADIDKYAPVLRKGIWRSGAFQDGAWKNAPDDSDANRGNSWSLRNRQKPDDYAPVVADSPNYSADGRSFSYSLGTLAPDDGYELSYYVEINGAFKNGDKFNNSAKLTGKGIVPAEKLRDFVVSEAGGFLNGQNFSIQIKKVGDDGKALQGAKFTLVNPKTKYTKTIVTDENGIAKLENVFKADYVLTEVEAPEGYDLDSTPRPISKTDFEKSVANGSTVEVEAVNKKKEEQPKFRNLSVKKEWVLDPALATNKPEKVKVSVLKNGVKDENLTVELSAANGWKASFSNLPKEDANGQEIVYTVSEESLAGFKAAISGTADYGFTISNYHGGKVVIPVTKIWRGEGNHPDSLKVYLYADGTKVATYTLNQANGWQHQFEAPKYKADGTVIRYTVMEEQVNGYSSSTQDDPVTGYVNVFTNTKTPTTPPVTPPTTPSEIPPVTPGGNNPRTPGGGGNTPNNPGGGGNTPNNPGGGGNTPNPPTPPSENPGEVLAANRNPEGNVLGAERPTVLGVGRGYTKTEDSRNIWVNLALFAIAGLSFYTILVLEKRRNRELY